jgi:hypothetical protein
MSEQRKIKALEALFDEGANFADYDEGKMSATQPDGYDYQNVDVAEVRNRAVKGALDALTPGPSERWGPEQRKAMEVFLAEYFAECCSGAPTHEDTKAAVAAFDLWWAGNTNVATPAQNRRILEGKLAGGPR